MPIAEQFVAERLDHSKMLTAVEQEHMRILFSFLPFEKQVEIYKTIQENYSQEGCKNFLALAEKAVALMGSRP